MEKIKIVIFILVLAGYQTYAQSDSISIVDLFKCNKIQSITVIDSSKILFYFSDTTKTGYNSFETEFSEDAIDLINNLQIEKYDSIKIEPYYLNTGNGKLIGWIVPIFLLLLLWIPGILAIIYFVRSKMRIEFKLMFIVVLILIPISGLIIYPLRFKLYRD